MAYFAAGLPAGGQRQPHRMVRSTLPQLWNSPWLFPFLPTSSMSLLLRFTSLVWLLLAAAFSSFALQSCGSDNKSQSADGTAQSDSSTSAAAGRQPLVDSTYVIKTFQAEPAFKAQLLAARRFYRE